MGLWRKNLSSRPHSDYIMNPTLPALPKSHILIFPPFYPLSPAEGKITLYYGLFVRENTRKILRVILLKSIL